MAYMSSEKSKQDVKLLRSDMGQQNWPIYASVICLGGNLSQVGVGAFLEFPVALELITLHSHLVPRLFVVFIIIVIL